jgi:uncharacterized protein (TIRG00374 family)
MKYWRLWIGLPISLTCLALVFHGVKWKEIYETLRHADLLLLCAAAFLIIAVLIARTARWSVLLIKLRKEESFARLFATLNIGYFLNNILPLRVGDVARACLWGRWTGVSKAATLSTIALEHVIDLGAAFVCFLILLPFVFLPNYFLWMGLSLGMVSILIIVFLMIVVRRQSLVVNAVAYLQSILPILAKLRIEAIVSSLMEGLLSIRELRRGLVLTLWTLLISLGQAIFIYLIFCSLKMNATFIVVIAVMVFTSLGMIIPSAPGSLGVYHLAAVSALGLFGIGGKQAVGFALVLHGLSYLVVSLMGLISSLQAGLSFGSITSLTGVIEN